MARGPNYVVVPGDWDVLEYIISDLSSRLVKQLDEGNPLSNYILATGSRVFTGNQSMGSHRLTNVLDPAANQDAATKIYVDTGLSALGDYLPLAGGTMIGQIASTLAIGTSPFAVTSTTVNTNLNADLWDGYQFTDYLDQSVKTGASPTFVNETLTGYQSVAQGILAVGATTGFAIPSGAGTRLMWIPAKAAFRVGAVSSTQWDTASIGDYSFATACNTRASGSYSTALGYGAVASNSYSTAIGHNVVASGVSSFAIGANNTASGGVSIATGYLTVSSGSESLSAGYGTKAESLCSAAFGCYNVGGGNANNWVATDPLFEIGKGGSDGARANALTILKNGNVNFHAGNIITTGNLAGHTMEIDTNASIGGNAFTGDDRKQLHLYSSDTALAGLRIQHSTSGTGNIDGFLFEQSGANSALVNYENGRMDFYTNATMRMSILANGNVDIGESYSSSYKLRVEGTCAIENELTIGTLSGLLKSSSGTVSADAFGTATWIPVSSGTGFSYDSALTYVTPNVIGTGYARFDAGLGVGGTPGTMTLVTFTSTLTATTTKGLNLIHINTRSTSNPATVRGLDFNATWQPATTTSSRILSNIQGGFGIIALNTTDIESAATQTITTGAAFRAGITITKGATSPAVMTTGVLFYAQPATVVTGGAITNLYSFYDAGQTVGTANWGIAINTANNYINGSLSIGKATAPTVPLDVVGAILATTTITATTSIVATTGFGCNSKAAQTAYASGGALSAYATGAFGFDSDAHCQEIHTLLTNIRLALVDNGIMS